MDTTAVLLQQLLLYGLLPLWLLAGFADWLCHRVQGMEHDAGTQESVLHWLMLAEMGPALAAALLLEVTAAVLALLFVLCLAHELTTWWDLRFAESRRRIPWFEQWVHALQLSLPWAGLAGLALIHHGQAAALLGVAGTPDWGWRAKAVPLPPAYVWGVAAAGVLLVALPFAEELLRCRRAEAVASRRRQLRGALRTGGR
ncbi:diguanylate cyclase [Azohydromonas aeria]|uniref:diguanylate cyclase n=1 Tax=Azohydromonas aeria TaxID=2590212 RepID=UPI0012F93D04|nr:diguanylate cyclase [Azohydromonas aeria]